MAGEWDKVEGTAKEWGGEATGDETTETEGKVQGAWGEGQDKLDDAKDTAGEKLGEGPDEVRERL